MELHIKYHVRRSWFDVKDTPMEDLYVCGIGYTLVDNKGKRVKDIAIFEGEPEDTTFYRDLSDVFGIRDMLEAAYDAGRDGECLCVRTEYIEDED